MCHRSTPCRRRRTVVLRRVRPLAVVLLVSLLLAQPVTGTVVVERASIGTAGVQGAKLSERGALNALRTDGRYVVFYSYADNLVAGDTFWIDVFVRDRLTNSTEHVSVDSAHDVGAYFSSAPVPHHLPRTSL